MIAAAKVGRALIASAQAAGVAISIEEDDFTRWASATFEGGRHLVKLQGQQSTALEHWIDGLHRLDRLGGQLVADLVVRSFRRGNAGAGDPARVRLEVLTVADA